MTNSHYPFLCLALLFADGVRIAADDPAAAAPPTFKGRTFVEWKQLLPNDLDPETRADAYRAMYAFSNQFPEDYLKPASEIIKSNLPKERAENVLLVGYQLLPKMSASERNALRIAGLRSDHRNAVANALTAYGRIPREEATEELADAVIEVVKKEPVVKVRVKAIEALQNIVLASEYDIDWAWKNVTFNRIHPEGKPGPIAKKAAPLMEKLMNDGDDSVRGTALNSFYAVYFPPEIAVERLAGQLKHLVGGGTIVNDFTKRRQGITDDERMAKKILAGLSNYGPQAKQALPLLQGIERDYPAVMPILGSSIRSTIKAIETPRE